MRRVKKTDEDLLKAHGYVYNFDRMAYFNRAVRKVFSLEWVEDHRDDLMRALEEKNESGDWQIYADRMPSRAVIDAFVAEVNG